MLKSLFSMHRHGTHHRVVSDAMRVSFIMAVQLFTVEQR